MSDRDLLMAAAKAAGYKVLKCPNSLMLRDCTGLSPFANMLSAPFWNPLADDGDALRLAVKLQLRVLPPEDEFGLDRASVRICGVRDLVDAYDNDPYAATRRAIVRAAAAMADGSKT